MHLNVGHAAAACFIMALVVAGAAFSQSSDERFGSGPPRIDQPQSQKKKATPRGSSQPNKAAKKAPGEPAPAHRPAKQPARTSPAAAEKPGPARLPARAIRNAPRPPENEQKNQAPVAAAPVASLTDEKLDVCLTCHGAGGRSEMPETPSLAGQPAAFLLAQLRVMLEGKREIPAMQPLIGELTKDNLGSYADRISKLPRPIPPPAPSDMARYERGQKIAAAFRCANCHSADFSGAGTNPRLAHQREDYLIKALRDYKSAARVDPGAIMAASVKELGDSDFIDVAYYLANLR